MGGLVPAQLDVGPLVTVGEPGLSHLVGSVLVPDGVLEVPDHALHLGDLVHSFLQVCLQLPGGLLRLRHPVGEGLLDPVRLLPQVLASVGEGAADDAPEPDAGLPLLLSQADVVVGESLPVPGQALRDVVQRLPGLALDVPAVVLQVDTAGVCRVTTVREDEM